MDKQITHHRPCSCRAVRACVYCSQSVGGLEVSARSSLTFRMRVARGEGGETLAPPRGFLALACFGWAGDACPDATRGTSLPR